MFISVINDCSDDNAMGRQKVRLAATLQAPVVSLGVQNDIEAAGNLVDLLDASQGEYGVIIVNVAPRNGEAQKQWPNGAPFCYFFIGKTLVLSSIGGQVLSLVKKFEMVSNFHLLDVPEVMQAAVKQGLATQQEQEMIANTQFRSFEFLPRVAKWLLEQHRLPSKTYSATKVADAGLSAWLVDNFGNIKTTYFPSDVSFEAGTKRNYKTHTLHCYERLKDVPDDELALIIGSSGFDNKRFLEIVVQGGNAAKKLKIAVGDEIAIR